MSSPHPHPTPSPQWNHNPPETNSLSLFLLLWTTTANQKQLPILIHSLIHTLEAEETGVGTAFLVFSQAQQKDVE